MVGLLGRVISSSQGLCLHRTTQHRQMRTNIHALSGIRTRDPVYERSRPTPQTTWLLDWRNILLTYFNCTKFSVTLQHTHSLKVLKVTSSCLQQMIIQDWYSSLMDHLQMICETAHCCQFIWNWTIENGSPICIPINSVRSMLIHALL
jgi:hypothetical protein